jgi:hypothetical protein
MGEALNANTFAELFEGELTEHYSYASPAQFGQEAFLAVWNAGSGNGTLDDFTGLIKNISDAVTTHLRLNGEDYQSDAAHGEVHYNTVCIRVHWPWVAYSGAVVGLTLLFFAWVVLQARREDEGVGNTPHDFKSGALTVLFHGLDDSSRRKLADAGSTNQQKELPKVSKHMKVHLVPTQSGRKLSTADM